ncbi:angiopoietin-related protein 4-like [Drosophila miranda]|uniref:angiopoietin-related protein 4-like n=1 Tax=Drosophila miranda TaxID=7229 RepID=UPI00143F194F|nr:angiopoietin-related protein 4-like [Drosophila miranda]
MNCAEYHHGAWWYDFCSRSNLNGKYFKAKVDNVQGIFWEQWYSFRSLRSVQRERFTEDQAYSTPKDSLK